jgi:hypothetical protein
MKKRLSTQAFQLISENDKLFMSIFIVLSHIKGHY